MRFYKRKIDFNVGTSGRHDRRFQRAYQLEIRYRSEKYNEATLILI